MLSTEDIAQVRQVVQQVVQESIEAYFAPFAKSINDMFVSIDSRLSALEADVAQLKADVAQLKADVAQLKVDVAQLKVDVAQLKVDVSQLKRDVDSLKAEVKVLSHESVDHDIRLKAIEKWMGDMSRCFVEVRGELLAMRLELKEIREILSRLPPLEKTVLVLHRDVAVLKGESAA